MKTGFRILEHPADVGIEATGQTLREAFENAAHGLIWLIAGDESSEPTEERYIKLTGKDEENLLVKWLSEILFLFDAEDFLTSEVSVERITPTQLEAFVFGETFDPTKHETRLDVKAITYHQLAIERREDGCTVRVFVDI
jgi:SHS2 domain-containing protein